MSALETDNDSYVPVYSVRGVCANSYTDAIPARETELYYAQIGRGIKSRELFLSFFSSTAADASQVPNNLCQFCLDLIKLLSYNISTRLLSMYQG